MDENKLYKSLIICVLVLASLSLCAFIPRIVVEGFELKSIDLFSDIRKGLPENEQNVLPQFDQPDVFDATYLPYFEGLTRYLSPSEGLSSISAIPDFSVSDENEKKLGQNLSDPIKKGKEMAIDLTDKSGYLEDFSPEGHSMQQFYKVLNQIKNEGSKGHIAFFGDSFIEGDIFCSDVRNSLQDMFGGNGVGFVPITSEVAQFRITIGHNFSGFRSYSVVKKASRHEPLGAGGYCFTAGAENSLTYFTNPRYKHLNLFHNIELFYTSPENTYFQYRLNKGDAKVIRIDASDRLQQKVLKDVNATSVSFNFPVSDTIKLYGASFEDSTGIYVDNFGIRGNSGLGLSQISEAMHQQFNQFQKYQLIILQYGLNVIAPDTKDLSWYINPMINVVRRIKRCYPEAAILIMSVSDRSTKVNDTYRTMASIPVMIKAQREIARQTQVAFYNLFEAMGGENSMVGFVENNPPLANKDYTHLNYQGGRKVAGIFVKSIFNEFQKYNARIKKDTAADNPLVVISK